MKRGYVEGALGQIHTRRWDGAREDGTPLICLPPSPFSGIAYETIAPLLAKQRTVIAMDYPGYGGSDPVPHAPSIEDYAKAAGTVAELTSSERPVSLLGFHTGSLVAVETARLFPNRIQRLVLVDVPFFEPDKRLELLTQMGVATPIQPDLSMLSDAWEFCVTNRLEHMPLHRAYELFIDQASAGERTNEAFRAAFTYLADERFAETTCSTFIVATQAGLYEPTCLAAKAIPGARLTEIPEVAIAVLEKGAVAVAGAVNRLLAEE